MGMEQRNGMFTGVVLVFGGTQSPAKYLKLHSGNR